MLTAQEWILLAICVLAIAAIFGSRLRPDLVAIMVSLSLGITGVLPEGEIFAGLSSSVVVTLISIFIITRALEDTGVIREIATRLGRLAGGTERRLVIMLTSSAATLSLVMNNVAAGARLLPAAVRLGRTSRVPLSKLLLPVSFGTLLGGMATYFTTANIILSDLLLKQGLSGLGFRDFLFTGGLIAVIGIGYMVEVGRHMLPAIETRDDSLLGGNLFGTYKLGERSWELTVAKDSGLVGQTIGESGIGELHGIVVLALRRGRRSIIGVSPDETIASGDVLLVLGREERVTALCDRGLSLSERGASDELELGLELAEVVIPPRSRAIGKTLGELQFRTTYKLSALALWRQGRVIRTDVGKTPLEIGDALLVMNIPDRVRRLSRSGDFVVAGSGAAAPTRPQRAWVAVSIFSGVLVAALTGLLPTAEATLAGATAMILAGCIAMDDAYRSIEWRVIFLVAGMLPIGIAMTETGLASRGAMLLGTALAGAHPLVLAAVMFGVTVLVTQVIGGQVSALLVGPIAIQLAIESGIAPQAMAMAVAIGASTAFLTPIAHPVNVLMMGTGGYRGSDFLKVGSGMTAVTLAMLIVGLWLFWGVR
jgi:di/tricarboxylate transporter